MRHLTVLVALIAAATLTAQTTHRVVMSKSFPGSKPAYAEVRLAANGEGEYVEDPKDEEPKKFRISKADTDAVFGLAQKLGFFAKPLESGLKVANMGAKSFRNEGDGGDHEVKFNYTEDADGRALLEWFEKIGESERALLDLESAVRFDKLGVQKAILQVEIVRDNKRLVAPEQFLPMLDRIARNENFMNMARTRAANLADSIRAGLGQ